MTGMPSLASRGKTAAAVTAASLLALVGCTNDDRDENDYFSIPREDYPRDIELTSGGTDLALGDEATVVIEGNGDNGGQGTIGFWKLNVTDLRQVSQGEVRERLGGELSSLSELPQQFVCIDYTYELLGKTGNTSGAVPLPEITPVDDKDEQGNVTRFFNTDAACGADTIEGSPEEGATYNGAYLSFKAAPGTMDEVTDPVGAKFTYGNNVLADHEAGQEPARTVIWR